MTKINLSPEELTTIQQCINDNVEIPLDIMQKLNPSFFDKLAQDSRFNFEKLNRYKIPTIEYAGKRSESTILASATLLGQSSPLQVERLFEGGKMKTDGELQMELYSDKNKDGNMDVEDKDKWMNMIVQGDNLQFLKTCYLNQDPLIKDKVKGKVKLVYIDPPFATKSDFGGKDGEYSYSDKVGRAEFLETLRERIIFLKSLLSDEGSIFLHLDQKMSHYVKIVMDEIFGKNNFRNEIVWSYKSAGMSTSTFPHKHDNILYYSKTDQRTFKPYYIPHDIKVLKRFQRDENGPYQLVNGKKYYANPQGKPVEDVWEILLANRDSQRTNYPTQKPEALLERIILSASNERDLVLDCFAGSGTTAAVAEKLGRRWITCDFGKHAIYTMQKRLLKIEDSKALGKVVVAGSKYSKKAKSFSVVSVGAFDFSKILDLRKHKKAYVDFVLELNGIHERDASKYSIPNIYGTKEGNPVEVYPIWDDEYLKNIKIDNDYLQGIIQSSGGKLKGDYYIIAPEICDVVGDKELANQNGGKVNFKILSFPYKILEEVSRHYQLSEQPSDGGDINNLISSTRFYFNEEVKFKAEFVKAGLIIKEFETNITDKDGNKFNNLDGLAMVLIDKDWDGNLFTMEEAVYLKDIPHDPEKPDYGQIKVNELTNKVAIIAIDKHGNESKIIVIEK